MARWRVFNQPGREACIGCHADVIAPLLLCFVVPEVRLQLECPVPTDGAVPTLLRSSSAVLGYLSLHGPSNRFTGGGHTLLLAAYSPPFPARGTPCTRGPVSLAEKRQQAAGRRPKREPLLQPASAASSSRGSLLSSSLSSVGCSWTFVAPVAATCPSGMRAAQRSRRWGAVVGGRLSYVLGV